MATGAFLTGRSSTRPVRSALQEARRGQAGQSGPMGVHCMAPKSIMPWLKAAGSSAGNNCCARAVNSFLACVVPTGVARPKCRASTLYTLPSTTAAGRPKQMEPMAAAV